MDSFETCEKNSGRVEQRTAFATCDTGWLQGRDGWEELACIGAVNARTTTRKGTTDEWHYHISNRELAAKDLLKHARLEWAVESMHWLLDVRFREDFCRIEDADVQQSLNIIRKIALNCVKLHKTKTGIKTPVSKIMFACLLYFSTSITCYFIASKQIHFTPPINGQISSLGNSAA
jgi:Transposase